MSASIVATPASAAMAERYTRSIALALKVLLPGLVDNVLISQVVATLLKYGKFVTVSLRNTKIP